MRDSNYKSVSNNRAAVTISTTVYDRRALDVTSDRPLVNSLNHLTYLVSSLAKVRETLSTDGGIERLIEILHECHNCNFSLNDTIFNSEKKILTAWKWTLAFQCLVLIGTRGTETIRQRVVRAGMLPIIATILDNYITLHDRNFAQASRKYNTQGVGFFASDTALNRPEQMPEPNPQASQEATLDGESQEATTTGTEPNTADEDRDFMSQFQSFQTNFGLETSNSAAAAALASTSPIRSVPFFSGPHSNTLTNDDFESLSIDQLFKLVRTGEGCDLFDRTGNSNSLRRRYLNLVILKKLMEEKDGELLDTRFSNDNDYETDNNLEFLWNMYIQDDKSTYFSNLATTKTSPRSFTETGVVIPRDDDIVWSLQLLAYISKYPYLKDVLQNTHLVIDMSVRDKQLKLFVEKQLKMKMKKDLAIKQRPTIKPKSRKSKLMSYRRNDQTDDKNDSSRLNFMASASNSPQLISSLNALEEDNFILDQDKIELCEDETNNVESGLTVNGASIEDVDNPHGESDPETGSVSDSGSDIDNFGHTPFPTSRKNRLGNLYDSIIDCESIVDRFDRELATYELNEKISKCVEQESKELSQLITRKRLDQKFYSKEKWNYDTYDNFNIDDQIQTTLVGGCSKDPDYDESLIEYKRVNLFPMVERFTFLAGTDMYYWSGVIMRNSCRRNEFRGGVRQCGNLECGRWETYPREFLKCRRCKRTKYCSRDCQMKAWHCHRNWCIPSSSSNTNTNNSGNGNENDDNDEPRPPAGVTPQGLIQEDGEANADTNIQGNNNNDDNGNGNIN